MPKSIITHYVCITDLMFLCNLLHQELYNTCIIIEFNILRIYLLAIMQLHCDVSTVVNEH